MLTAEQLRERESGIGSSDAGAVLGVNPYMSPVDIYLEKTGQRESPDLSDNQAVHFGNVLEQTVAEEYARRTGNKVMRRNKTFRHSDYPWMVAHPDRTVVGQKKILECKTAGQYLSDQWGPDGSDQVPDQYLIQVHHQMIVMGYAHADLAVLIGGRDFRIYHLEQDTALDEIIIERERAFWQDHVEQGLPPESRDTRDLASLYPSDSGNTELASAESLDALEELKTVREKQKALSDKEAQLKQRIQSDMKDASALVDDRGKTVVTWKQSKPSTRFDSKAFANAYPDLYAQFAKKTKGSRRFLIK